MALYLLPQILETLRELRDVAESVAETNNTGVMDDAITKADDVLNHYHYLPDRNLIGVDRDEPGLIRAHVKKASQP